MLLGSEMGFVTNKKFPQWMQLIFYIVIFRLEQQIIQKSMIFLFLFE